MRAQNEDGFMMIELMAAMMVLSIAVLALMAGYDAAFSSLHKSATSTAAGTLAQNQLELYSALSYSSIGLDAASLTSTKASDSTYNSDEAALGIPAGVTAADATLASTCTQTQCLPVQTLTGSDNKSYRVETFIRNLTGASWTGRAERMVTIIVRSSGVTGTPWAAQMSAAFDSGP